MDYNKPTDVVANMIEAGRTKLGLSPRDLVIRGILAWAILATATTLAFGAAVVNMFVVPTGMMMGAKVSATDWWLWNQIPVTLGNLVGGGVFTGLALYLTHKPKAVAKPLASTAPVAVE